MIYQESTRVRTIVGRLERGDDVVDELTSFCKEHDVGAAEVRGVGRLEAVELVRFEPEADDYVTVFDGEGDFELLNLSGNVATLGDERVARLQAVVSASGPVVPQVLTGQLRSARAVEFEFTMEIYEDLEFERRLDPESGMLALQTIKKLEIEQKEEQASAGEPSDDSSMGGQSMSWDDAAEAAREGSGDETSTSTSRGGSEKAGREESSPESIYGDMDLDTPVLEAGDVLDHPKLGRCRVIKVEDGQYAHIRLPRGKIRKLSLDVVEIRFREEDNGRNVFEAQVAR